LSDHLPLIAVFECPDVVTNSLWWSDWGGIMSTFLAITTLLHGLYLQSIVADLSQFELGTRQLFWW